MNNFIQCPKGVLDGQDEIMFFNKDLVGGKCFLTRAILSDQLESDTLEFEVYSPDTNYSNYVYGKPVLYFRLLEPGIDFFGRFYIDNVVRENKYLYKFSCISAMGLLSKKSHFGGYYRNTAARTIINDILSGTGISPDIQTEVSQTPLTGWLPPATARDNLRQVLFALGASVAQNSLNTRILFAGKGSVKDIDDRRLAAGGKTSFIRPVTQVNLTEHSYYLNTAFTEVFDNTTAEPASNSLVVFDRPIDISTAYGVNGLTVNSRGRNWVKVTGSGVLMAKEYSDAARIITAETGATGAVNEVSVTDATLVSALNSHNVLQRLANYYSAKEEISYDMVLGSERIGDFVSLTDPFGDTREAFIQSMDITMSNTIKAKTKFYPGITLGPFGNSLSSYENLTESGTITLSAGYHRIVLIGGGSSGCGGYAGGNGIQGTRSQNGAGGAGGAGGEGGNGGKILIVDLDLESATEFSYTIGTGGRSSSSSGTSYNGTATTFGAYTSANGNSSDVGYTHLFTGALYATPGDAGTAGGYGGGSDHPRTDHPNWSVNGEDVGHWIGSTYWWSGGTGGYSWYDETADENTMIGAGGGGGGAAVGANGGNGRDGWYLDDSGTRYWYGGAGGAGASPVANTTVSGIGCGGAGGHGGGGGGGGGMVGYTVTVGHTGQGGTGGSGGASAAGGAGIIIVYS